VRSSDNCGVTFYRRNLPHLQRDAKPHFITFVTKYRLILPECARDIVLGCCQHDDGIRYKLHVAVVMPDHVHIVLTPLVDPARQLVVSLAEIMKGIKGSSAHALNHRMGQGGTVWQEESFDRVLRSSESLDAKIEYVLNNPVRKGLVSDWHHYPWLWHQPFMNPYAPPVPT
jgi:REP element-mobilizing transposase RayT